MSLLQSEYKTQYADERQWSMTRDSIFANNYLLRVYSHGICVLTYIVCLGETNSHARIVNDMWVRPRGIKIYVLTLTALTDELAD